MNSNLSSSSQNSHFISKNMNQTNILLTTTVEEDNIQSMVSSIDPQESQAQYIQDQLCKEQLSLQDNGELANGIQIFEQQDILRMNGSHLKVLFENLKYLQKDSQQPIFKVGDTGDQFYIILQGSVFCLLPEEKDSSYDNRFASSSKKRKSMLEFSATKENELRMMSSGKKLPQENFSRQGSKTIALIKQEIHKDSEQMFQLQSEYPDLQLARIYESGDCFGEIALMTNQRRAATIVCREQSHFLTLSQKGFQELLGAKKEFLLEKQLQFLKKFSFFGNFSNQKLMQVFHMMKKEKFSKNNVIYSENDPSCYVFFILSGEIRLSRLCSFENPDMENSVGNLQKHDPVLLEINRNQKSKDLSRIQKRIDYVILGAGSYFGQEEIFQNNQTRKSQAICLSQSAQIYVLDRQKFLGLLKNGKQLGFSATKELQMKTHIEEEKLEQCLETRINAAEIMSKAVQIQKAQDLMRIKSRREGGQQDQNQTQNDEVHSERQNAHFSFNLLSGPKRDLRKIQSVDIQQVSQLSEIDCTGGGKQNLQSHSRSDRQLQLCEDEKVKIFNMAYAEKYRIITRQKQKLLQKLQAKSSLLSDQNDYISKDAIFKNDFCLATSFDRDHSQPATSEISKIHNMSAAQVQLNSQRSSKDNNSISTDGYQVKSGFDALSRDSQSSIPRLPLNSLPLYPPPVNNSSKTSKSLSNIVFPLNESYDNKQVTGLNINNYYDIPISVNPSSETAQNETSDQASDRSSQINNTGNLSQLLKPSLFGGNNIQSKREMNTDISDKENKFSQLKEPIGRYGQKETIPLAPLNLANQMLYQEAISNKQNLSTDLKSNNRLIETPTSQIDSENNKTKIISYPLSSQTIAPSVIIMGKISEPANSVENKEQIDVDILHKKHEKTQSEFLLNRIMKTLKVDNLLSQDRASYVSKNVNGKNIAESNSVFNQTQFLGRGQSNQVIQGRTNSKFSDKGSTEYLRTCTNLTHNTSINVKKQKVFQEQEEHSSDLVRCLDIIQYKQYKM